MARPRGFEPLTAWFVARYSIQLSYGRVLGCRPASVMRRRIVYAGPQHYNRKYAKFINLVALYHYFFGSNKMQIIGVYHAYSGVLGELKYITGKVMGTAHCALCDITHGWHPLGKAEWRQEIKQWGNLKTLHINDQPAAMAALTKGRTPGILLATEGHFDIIIGSAQLAACKGDIQAMLCLIRDALDKSANLSQ